MQAAKINEHMKRAVQLFLFSLILLGYIFSAQANSKYKITGPYTVKNLSIYLVHGKSNFDGKNYITLSEAMKQKKVKVYETGSVNNLMIENLSAKDHIYIQSGDIVKGGKQDRVFQHDLVLTPGSGKKNIASFCVEKGRWNPRGKESNKEFSRSSKRLASKELRMAVKYKASQREVWDKVDKFQKDVSAKTKVNVKSAKSATSLQLSLENKAVKTNIKEYETKLAEIVKGKKDVVGFAFSINGKLNTADIYLNNQLFAKLWPKLLEAAATEAMSEFSKGKKFAAPKSESVQKWFAESNQGKVKSKTISASTKLDTIDSKENLKFNTYSGKDSSSGVLRINIMKK